MFGGHLEAGGSVYSESLPVREHLSERLKENSTCEIMADDCGPGSAVETALHGLV